LFETEIDTLVNALGQEWGKFDDTLRKACHHETVSYLRNDEEVFIDEPRVAAVLSGTVAQFQRLIGSAENGLYSRFAVYTFSGAAPWKSQRPTPAARLRREQFDVWAEDVLALYRVLSERTTPLWITWEDDYWTRADDVFAPMKRTAQAEGLGHLESVVHRAGLVCFRLSVVLAVVRAFEAGRDVGRAKTLTATDADVSAALDLAALYADHALRFARAKLSDGTPTDPQALRIRAIMRGTGDAFTNANVYALGRREGLGVTPRQLRRDLHLAAEWGLIESPKRGQWVKL
jgi:hypothetical protein